MNKIRLLRFSAIFLLFICTACREEFDDHYHSVGNSSIGLNVVQVLEEREDLSLFVQMIKRANLERTLGESGLYTCFAPRNNDVQAFLDANQATVETLPMTTLVRYVNYHFMTGMKFQYDFEKEFDGFDNTEDYWLSYAQHVTWTTRGDDNNPSKYIRVFTTPYLSARGEDYKLLRATEAGDFMVETAKVSPTERDIPASNGVVHVLDDPLPFAPRADEAIAAQPDMKILMSWLNRFVGYESKGVTATGEVDTTQIKYYNISHSPIKPWSVNIADETTPYIILAPTDDAIEAYFKPYMTPELLGTTFDSIPNNLVIPILWTFISPTNICWGMSDLERNQPYYISYNATVVPYGNDLASMYSGSVLSSNAVIYKMKKMVEIPILQTIEGGIYIQRKKYQEWNKLLTLSTNVGDLIHNLLTDDISYQHPERTLLIQPDSKWEKKVEDYETAYLDTLVFRMMAGVINMHVKNGKFEHRYYPTAAGYVLYNDGVFTDFKGNTARLMSGDPSWSTPTGSMYEIDNIFEQLLSNDTTQLMYRNYIERDADFSIFKELCNKTEFKLSLESTYGALYTVFAPTNEAWEAAGYTLSRVEDMDKEAAEKLLYPHVIANRKIFTDGMTRGSIPTMGGVSISLNGAWETFRITSQYGGAGVIENKSNKQASNGIFHGINGVLK